MTIGTALLGLLFGVSLIIFGNIIRRQWRVQAKPRFTIPPRPDVCTCYWFEGQSHTCPIHGIKDLTPGKQTSSMQMADQDLMMYLKYLTAEEALKDISKGIPQTHGITDQQFAADILHQLAAMTITKD